jgi:CheY-like chemotaxis protein
MKKLNRVLLIDDDEVTNMLNEIVIKDFNNDSEVMIASNGAEALDFLKETKKQPTAGLPDIIFLDINMPIMNGFEFLEELNKIGIGHNNEPSIVLLTSSQSHKDIEESKKYHQVAYYINKPLTEEKLSELLNQLV